ncbi:MAG: hypothetical protein SOZ21_05000 [Candidatus Cryptobacteroides sp.]|nr:hypothetical protein [Candidatus Cryptobacteroides sp.]
MMKLRLFLTIAFLTLSHAISAQLRDNTVDALLQSLRSGVCTKAEFRMVLATVEEVPVEYGGEIFYQDGKFRITGKDFSIFCNSEHIWTIDYSDGEVVRQDAMLISDLIPEGEISASFSEDGSRIRSISIKAEKGTVNITVPSMTFIPEKPESFYTLDVGSLPPNYVVTEL